MKNKKNYNLIESFNSALNGLLIVIKRERNFKIHLIIAVIVILLSLFLHIPFTEILIILIFISMVMISEIINTGIEILSENIVEKEHNIIKIVKDICASAVLISSLFAFIGGYLIFIRFFPEGFRNIFEHIAQSSWYYTFFILLIVSFFTLLLKILTGKKFNIVGGMPSIHSGIAFSIWTAISFLTFKEYPVISILVLLLSFWVAQSRITKKIHTIGEVVIGGIIGIFITILLFQILWSGK
ncbi:MAG: diacylglycerol kinase [bacterium]|nr:diacylglycerol kinase [bacterium]